MVATKATRSRRKTTTIPKKTLALDGETIVSVYCRKCRENKPPAEFYDATDSQLDTNGKMSVCKDCIDIMFTQIYRYEHDINKTILKLCRILNIVFLDAAVNATVQHIGKIFDKNGNLGPVFGYYKSKVSTMSQLNSSGILTFSEPGTIVSDDPDAENAPYDVQEFWGEGLNFDDYQFLEAKMAKWKPGFSHDNAAKMFFLKEACFKELELKKARIEGKSTDSILKSMDMLVKTGNLAPVQTSAGAGDENAETIGTLIKRVETTDPAEYYKDVELFKDYDHIIPYILNYIKRPIENFFNGNKNYSILDENGMMAEEKSLEI